MKKIFAIAAILSIVFTSVMAQTNMKIVNKKGEVVYTQNVDKVQSILFETVTTPYKPEGALTSYEYSVSETKKVFFSKGNLQYQASTDTWRFAENQYDYIGDDNENISATYDGWIDLFGWGTSGWNSGAIAYMPYSTSTTSYDYFPGNSMTANLTDAYANADWGVYNAISNGGNTAGQWRTLTKDEWTYLLSTRSSELRSFGNVNYKAGLIILPDNWVQPKDVSYTSTISNFTTNVYTTDQWAIMEANGAIFLPAAGCRTGSSLSRVGAFGLYWSSLCGSINFALNIKFLLGSIDTTGYSDRYAGEAVRLVQDVK